MNSQLLSAIHIISVNVFVLIYLVKTILIFTNESALQKFVKATKALEMLVSALFLITGVWLFFILGAIKAFQIIKLICVFAAIPVAVGGFKRMKKGLALLSLILILGAYGLSDMAKSKPYIPNSVEVTGNADEATKLRMQTYIANCAMCHGLDGKKQYRGAPDLSASTHDVASIPLLIKEGSKSEKGVMPAFGSTLSEEQINAVAAYVVTLRK